VSPILNASCAGSTCHEGTGSPSKFLGQTGTDDNYDAMIAQPAAHGGYADGAPVLSKVELGNHFGTSYTEAQSQAISDWLVAERTAAADGGTPPPVIAVAGDPLAEWSGCMTLGNWNQANMGNWADKQTNGDGPCSTCHNDGEYRFAANGNNETMFRQNRTSMYVISFVTVSTDALGNMEVVPALEKLRRMGNGTTLHPLYNVNENNQQFLDLDEFVELTRKTMADGDCLAPGYLEL